MRKGVLCLICVVAIPFYVLSQDNFKIDSLQQEISKLNAQVALLKNDIQSEILKNGYVLTCKSSYSRLPVELKDKAYGSPIDTIPNGASIKIIDKTSSCFKVQHNDLIGYINIYDIDIKDHPSLIALESSSLRNSNQSSNYSSGSGSNSSSGTVSVKGYYRKDGTYVKPHTRSAPKRK